MSKRKIDRRDFLKGAAITGAGLAVGGGLLYGRRALAALLAGDQGAIDRAIRDHKLGQISDEDAQATVAAYMTEGSGAGESRVIHVHDPDATSWDFGDDYYGDFVGQDVVDTMVDQGVMELTGTTSVTQAWQILVPNYAPGKAIVVKVNFNNCFWCDSSELAIDALIHPINAIVRGLFQAYPGFDTADIWVYDASTGNNPRQIPQRFNGGCLYAGVRFFDGGCRETASYDSTDPTAAVIWYNPPEIPTPAPAQVTDVLVNASYVINMPIIKRHGGAGTTLSFKNHFGSLANCRPLHDWVFSYGPHYGGTTYNPMVDIYRNEHILGKTVLTVGDALFGNWQDNLSKPLPWSTFGNNAPNSLLFSADPVAIDCVMCDLLDAENPIWSQSYDCLVYAAACGLGTYESGDPWGIGYNLIDYVKVAL